MKRIVSFLIIYLLLIAANCSGGFTPSRKSLESNKMNFPELEKRAHGSFSYMLSSLFKDAYSNHFVLKTNATTKSISDLNIFFSIETFDQKDIETMRFLNDSKKSDAQLIHDYYINLRQSSLSFSTVSTRKKLEKKSSFPGYIQHVIGKNRYETKSMLYMTATLEIDGAYHVFQLIGPKDNMGYFYDDFLNILNSIEK